MRCLATVIALSAAMSGCSLYFEDPDDSEPGATDAGIVSAPDAAVAQSRCDTAEPNDRLNAPATILTGLVHELAVCPAGDVDFFEFVIADDGLYIEVTFENSAGSGDLDIRLYDEFRMQVDLSAGFGNEEVIDRNDLAAGTYFLEVYGYTALIENDYDLTVVAN